jgi:hypothetical protein
MNLKLVMAVSLFTAVPMVALAQQKNGPPPPSAPKPTIAAVQKVVQMIGGDKAKLQAYCDIGKLQDQMEAAYKKKDNKAGEALGAKIEALGQQIGPDYVKMMDGLDQVDPNSAEGKQFTAVFDPLDKQCK